jgi:DNA-binding transcriptional LysR family regulator
MGDEVTATVELRQLRYFVAVAEERHFRRAADRLQIAQPGLSQQIKRLERSLGVQLLIRDTHRVELTAAGEALLRRARITLEAAERAVEETIAAARGTTGLLKVGTYSLGTYPAATELVREFGVRFPGVAIDVHPAADRQSIDVLVRREIDVAIMLVPIDAPDDVQYHPLSVIEPVVVLPSGHALASLDKIPRPALLGETFIAPPRAGNPLLMDHIHAVLFGETQHPHVVELSDLNEIFVRVANGEGFAVVDPSRAELEITGLAYRRFEDPAPRFEYGVFWLEDIVAPFLERFIEVARELVPAS